MIRNVAAQMEDQFQFLCFVYLVAVANFEKLFCRCSRSNKVLKIGKLYPHQIENGFARSLFTKIFSYVTTFFSEHLKKSESDAEESLVPWLQISNGLIPFIKDKSVQALIHKIILDLCQSCKTIPVKNELFRCTSSFVNSFEVDSIFAKMMCNYAMNSIGLNQCVQYGNKVLRDLLQRDLIKDFDGLFSQFIEQRIKCCKSSIQTLIFLIKKKPNLIHQQEKREILLNWLIGNSVDIEDDKTENWQLLLKV